MAKIYQYDLFKKICYEQERSLTFKQIHKMYLLTDKWNELRDARLSLDDYRCRMCNTVATCVHHRCYPEILGEETLNDLTSLCDICHHNFHFPIGIEEAKEQFFKTLQDGKKMNCPICNRYAKYELRPLNSTMARSLIWITIKYQEIDDWVNVPEQAPSWLLRTNQHTTLAKWGLLERRANHKDKLKKHTGHWRPTNLGIRFVSGECAVPWKVCLWDDTKIGESEEEITIQEAVASGGFDYSEILKNPNTEIASLIEKRIKKSTKLVLH